MSIQAQRRGTCRVTAKAVLLAAVVLGLGGVSFADEGEWSLSIEPLFVNVYGHDQHILTTHEIDFDSIPRTTDRTGLSLDTDSGPGYRGEVQYSRGGWTWGVDFFWFKTNQSAPGQTASASGAIDEVVFEVADQEYRSSGPDEVLYFRTLGDTAIAVWTVDLYGMRTLAEGPDGSIRLQFGLRNGDFDNDFRAVVGIEGVRGSRFDASSNYDRMNGLLLGLAGNVRLGRNEIDAHLSQSLLIGNVELSNQSREFSGSFDGDDNETFDAQELFTTYRDVAIPVSEFRIRWTYEVTERISLGGGIFSSVWWDVPVAPGVIPGEGGDQVLHENTIIFLGGSAAVIFTF